MPSSNRHFVVAFISLLASLGIQGRGLAAPAGRQSASARVQYRVDAKKSRFIVETETSALSLKFAHDHKIEAGEFSGAATFSPGAFKTASLELTVQTASLHLIEEKDVANRESIEGVLREEVLEAKRYPQISFKSRGVTSERRGDGTYDVRLVGELFLHGVRRTVTIPARVAVEDGTLHAIGVFEIRQTDFKITPFSFITGTVVIKDDVTVSFDIVANRAP